jgi:tripartite-type tricarboxylate transporter receptor subunit TctC
MQKTVQRVHYRWLSLGLVAAVAASAAVVTGSAKGADADFLKGKTFSVVVGYSPGGGYDRYARTLGAHLKNHLPGKPTVVVRNMPGASSIRAANYIYSKAPRDGTVIGIFSASATFSPLLGKKASKFKPDGFTWIGNMDQSTGTCSVWHTSGLKSYRDLLKRDVIFGASGPNGFDSEYARAVNKLLGTRIRVIHGYNGSSSVMLAVQRGEVMGYCGFSLSSLKSVWRQHFNAGRLVPLMQFALKSPDLKGVPHVVDLAGAADTKQVFKLIFNRDILGRPVAGPPKLPADRTKVLRTAFTATVNDKRMRKAAARRHMTLSPRTGAQVEALVREFMAIPPDAIAKAREALTIGKVEKAKLRTLEATIAKVSAKRIELKDAKGGVTKLRVHRRRTAVLIGNKKAAAKALKPGMACTVRYLGAGDFAKTLACK